MKRFFIAASLLALTGLTAAPRAPLYAQSLADVAKKTEEERAKAAGAKKEPPKVITNEDLKKKPDEAPDPATAGAEKEVAAKPAAGKTSTTRRPSTAKPATRPAPSPYTSNRPDRYDPKQNEAYWKQRATYLHQRLDADERTLASARDQAARAQQRSSDNPCIGCPEARRLESQAAQLKRYLTGLEAQVNADKALIQAFEEEGRTAGILPGWLRPY